jgi:DNA-3-methyladenine glycosylase II
MVGKITPESISRFSQEEIASCGLTKSKASYILDIANNPKDFLSPNFSEMSDAEINKHFVSFRGIGPWTSEMLMIFGLLKPDIFSIGDIGLVKAVKILEPSIETKEEVTAFAERWSPFRTAASWYLWRMLDPVPVAY